MLSGVSMSWALSEQMSQSKAVHACVESTLPFCEQHIACGCTIGLHDVGMHTSAPAMRSTLPATDPLDNGTRKAQLQEKKKPRRSRPPTLSLPHSFSPSLPPHFIMRV